MAINISQDDYNVLKQAYIEKWLKLEVLNFSYNVVDEISGNMVSCSVSVDSESDIRRTCSVGLVVTDSSFDIQAGGKVWLDKLIRPYVGYLNIRTGEIQWYNQGVYLINEPSYQYDATTNTLSFTGVDLMSKLTGMRNGNLEGLTHIIPQGSNVREAMIATLALAGFNKYIINECANTDGAIQAVPYDIEIEQGGTVYDILAKLRDILPQYQIYFDVNGVFHYEPIPDGADAPVLIDDDLWGNVLISETVNTDFESVKNVVEVYGGSHDVTYYSTETAVSGGAISLTIADLTEAAAYTLIGFTLPSAVSEAATISINSGTAVELVNSNGAQITALAADTYYVASMGADGKWLFMGGYQPHAIAKDENPDSPFYIGNDMGEIRIVLYGGDYDNITSDELAQQRADLEIYWRCRLNDNISLTSIPIPWVDVNIVISHATKGGTEQARYIIKSYTADYGESNSMTITAITFYPYYPSY